MKAIFTGFWAILLGLATIKAQILPSARAVDWTGAGLMVGRPIFTNTIDLAAAGLVGDGSSPNDLVWQAVVAPLGTTPTILQFPAGVFLFNNPITLPSNVILRGMTADSTKLLFNLGGVSDCIRLLGSQSNSDTTYLMANVTKGASFATVTNASRYAVGAYLRLIQNDSSEMFSTWAYKTLGQIVRVDSIVGNEIHFSSPLRRAYDLSPPPLYGNFPYANLFEGNIVQNIVIDNSHDANGEHNTFFRNRAELYGIFFSNATSPNQNFIANDVTNTSNGLYTLQGSGHFEYANRYRGATRPTGTDATFLGDISYYRSSAPSFLPSGYFASIGLPNAENEAGNAADRDRFAERLANSCGTASRPRINFAATAPIQVMENVGAVLIPVKIDNVNFDPTSIEISYLAASTTAVENIDFTGLSLSAPLAYTWAGMDNSTAFLSLQITDDQLTENMETIRLVLRNADNGAIIGADSTIFIQILDNDAVAISENTTIQTRVFPNPTSQNIFVQSQQPWAFVRLIDLQGRTLIALPRADDAPLNFSVDISTLPDGLYWLQLNGHEQQGQGQMIRIAR